MEKKPLKYLIGNKQSPGKFKIAPPKSCVYSQGTQLTKYNK